mgnify:CR=1 FL=1
MSNESITVRAPQVFLESNLNFSNNTQSVTEVTVTRARCIDPTLLDSFLRTMRHGSDDVLKQKINNATKNDSTWRSSSEKCGDFIKSELYPNWQQRNRVISFCQNQASQMKKELDSKYSGSEGDSDEVQVATRIDPYAERDRKLEKESRYRQWRDVGSWVENNLQIESILRTTSQNTLQEKCNANQQYLEDFKKFIADNE